jgi:hypothetical protein
MNRRVDDSVIDFVQTIRGYKNVPVQIAAEYMGVSPMFIRFGLRDGKLPIGIAIQMTNERFTYHISPERLISYQTGRAER